MFNKHKTSALPASSAKGGKSFFRQSVSLVIVSLMVLQNLLVALPTAAQSDSRMSPLVSGTVVISEFRFRGPSGASDEFVELYNLTGSPIDISGWKINGSNNAAGTTTRATIAANTGIPGYGHFLLTNSTATTGYSGSVAGNQTYTTGITDDGGVGLLNAAGTVIDQVGLSSGSAYKEGTTLASLTTSTDRCYERKPGGAGGNGQDTDNNSADFQLITPCNPQNLASATTPPSTPTNPTGTGAANPSSVTAGGTTLLTVTVAQGANPSSAITGVSGNLSAIGGGATQQFFNDGTHGDVTAGDNIFSFSATVDGATTAGAKTLPVTITDALNRTGTTSIALTVTSVSTAPSATGAASPNSLSAGNSTLLTVTVMPGANPASTGLAVTGNLSSIGGSAAQTFFDNGTNGDATPGDNVFSFTATVAAGTTTGAKSLPVTITDAQSRTASATISLTVTVPPQVTTAQTLPFSQNWSNTALISSNGDWNNVPGIIGYRGDDLTTAIGADPQTILADGASTPVDITANQTNPDTYTSGGLVEFELSNPTVAFQGSATSDAPNLVIKLDTTGQSNITVSYNLRDIDGSADNAVQPVALQYRVGGTGSYTNVPAAFVADATSGPNLATLVTPVNVALPAEVGNQPLVYLRIITANATGGDEFVGIDDISVVSGGTVPLSGSGSAGTSQVQSGGSELLKVTVNPATNPTSTGVTVTGDLTSVGGSATQTFYDDGTNGDAVAGDNIFSYSASIPANASGGSRTIPVSVADAQSRTALTSITFTVIPAADPQEHLVMGNPSNAVTDTNQPFNYLLSKPQYAVSYHRDRAIPNWVSWHLDSTWIGTAARQDDFRPDDTLPSDWYHVTQFDYSGSGFDRGHHSPSADRTRSIPDNSATFLMTNMMPQAPGNNQGPWANLEDYSRSLVSQGNELYIIAGGVGTGGTGSNGGVTTTIAGGKVTVPEYTWKVIMVLPNGDNDVSRVNNNTRTIAIIMPNVDGVRPDAWQKYLATVDQVEQLTGYDFFSNVPVNIQAVIESRLDSASNTSSQTVAGGTYANLTVNSPNTTMSGDATVTGTLTLGVNTLITGSYKITLAPGATVSRESGFVMGNVERQFTASSPPAFEYPVGTASGYSPLTVNLTALGVSPSSLTVSATEGVEPNAPNPNLALKRYWTLTENGDITANLTFHYLDGDVPTGVSESSFKLYRNEGTFVEVPATVAPSENTATATGISQFSDWTLLAPAAPTAASVAVGGRVTTANGRGIRNIVVTMTDGEGNVRTAQTSAFGYYRFETVAGGGTYVFSARGKHYSFSQQTQVLSISEDTGSVNFIAYPSLGW